MREFEILKYLKNKGASSTSLAYLTKEDWGMLRGISRLDQKKTEELVNKVVGNGWEYYVEQHIKNLYNELDEKENKEEDNDW